MNIPAVNKLFEITDNEFMKGFCSMFNRRKSFDLIFSHYHCQKFSPFRFSSTPQAEFEPVQNLSSGFGKWVCAVVITTTPQRIRLKRVHNKNEKVYLSGNWQSA